jgi:hypothetical protein
MNITELDQYSLKDAVKFQNRLNPKIWGRDEHLLPEVAKKLEAIAADFQEFLGVPDLDVEDITISGSNAAYSYTPTSDIDLHLVVRMPAENSEVFQELFNAKKYQYNNEHDIRIGGADVELYVQPSDQTHHSQGIYSVRDGQWLQVPRRKKADIDDHCVSHKTQDLQARIEQAVKSQDESVMQQLWDKIKTMRQTGLETAGEFGCDNLVFKMLRKSGHIEQLKQAKTAAHDRALSLAEKQQPKQRVRYGFSEGHYGSSLSSEDGVAPSTCMFLNEADQDEQVVRDFIADTAKTLGIERMPEIHLHRDDDWAVDNHSFGMYVPEQHVLHVNLAGRHLMDILRTTAHELAHCRQHEIEKLEPDSGNTGSPIENEAHAVAGIIMRNWADAHPELFDRGVMENASGYIPTKKQAKDPRYAMALSVDIKPGEVGRQANKMALKTGRNGEPTLLMKSANLLETELAQEFAQFTEAKSHGYNSQPMSQVPGEQEDDLGNQEATGPEFPPQMPAGTTKIDVDDLTDWYRLGMDISDLDDADPKNYGKGPPQTVVVFPSDEAEQGYLKQFKRLGLKTHDMDPDVKGGEDVTGKHMKDLKEAFDLLEDEFIGEIKMSPTNLRAEAAKTGAMAGMEFEMIVPAISGGDDDVEYEPDYDQDERCRSIDQAVDFFHDGDYNGRREVERLRDRMNNDYQEWVMEQIDNDWANDKDDIIREWVKNNVDPEEWLPLVDDNTDEEQAFEQFVGDIVDDSNNSYHEQALDEFREEKYQDYDENDWLGDQDLDRMSSIEGAYDISWPFWTENNRGAGDIDMIADEFSAAIGRPVNASSRYHGATREKGKYVVEPDGSLSPDDPDDTGLEFVSPPLPLDELLSDLNKVRAWANRMGCYTNKSTGLHINVSVPNYDLAKLDYVKLALLLGDQYVLDQFGRSSNTYTKSAMGKVQDLVRQNPDKAQALLDKMRGHMDDFATKAIHSGTTDKFTSINTKDGYIEFRSPGGDWLDDNFDKIETTLLRFTVALSAAMDPEAYREEYQKKLYKLLTQDQDKANTDTIKYFSDYVAGKIPQAALRSFVKQAQLQRQITKDPTGGQQYWWRVYKDGKGARNGAMIEVVARTKAEAIDKAGAEWGLFSREYRSVMDAEPVRPYDQSPAKARVGEPQPTGPQIDYEIFNVPNSTVVHNFRAQDNDAALAYFDQYMSPGDSIFYDVRRAPATAPAPASQLFGTHTYRAFDLRNNQTLGTFQAGEPGSESAAEEFAAMLAREGISAQYADYEVIGQERQRSQPTAARPNRPNVGTQTDMENRLGWPDQTGDANYEIVDRRTNRPVFLFVANTEADAANKYQQWLAAAGYTSDPQEFGWRQREPTQATPQQSSGEFTGKWLILDPQGRTIHRFGGIGNSQSDANRVAIAWLRAHPGSMQAGVTVVPEMS